MILSLNKFHKLLLGELLVFSLGVHGRRAIDRTVMIVNDDIILESDIGRFQQKLKSKSFQELFGGIDASVLGNSEAVLQLIIEEKIIDQQVKKLDLAASEQEIDGQIRAILSRNSITKVQLEERLKQLGATIQDYREGLKRQIERRNLIEREIKPTLEVNDEQLRHFYLRQQKNSDKEYQYKIAHILISIKKGTNTKLRSDKIWADANAFPEKFPSLAKDYSDDDSTSGQGGVLGFFSISQLAKEFRDLVPKTEIGSVTKPIRTSAGYHIVKVLEKRAGGDFASLPKEQKDSLKNQLVASEMEKRMAMWLERKKTEAYFRKAAKNEDQP